MWVNEEFFCILPSVPFSALFKLQIDAMCSLTSETLVKGNFFPGSAYRSFGEGGLVQHRHGTRQASFHALTCYANKTMFTATLKYRHEVTALP